MYIVINWREIFIMMHSRVTCKVSQLRHVVLLWELLTSQTYLTIGLAQEASRL